MKFPIQQRPINGYDDNQPRKDKFMREATKFLKALGKILALRGLTEAKYSKNAGGIACGGDVYAEFYKPNADVGVYITIGADIGAGLGRNADGIHCMTRWIERNAAPKRSRRDGSNVWLKLDKDAEDIAEACEKIAQTPLPAI